MGPQQDAMRRIKHHFCDIPAKYAQTEFNHEETSDKPQLRDILQKKKKKKACNLQKSQGCENQERLMNCSRLKKTREL